MSSKKQPTLWQRFKELLKANKETTSDTLSLNLEAPCSTEAASHNQVENLENPKNLSNESTFADRETEREFLDAESSDAKNALQPKQTTQDNPRAIVDAVFDYLDANDLTYRYRKSIIDNAKYKESTSDSDDMAEHYTVHHISLGMRYHINTNTENQTHSETSDNDAEVLEWWLLIRIEEQTKLISMYGILPFQLPQSHMNSALALAAQLNFEMMFGSVDIDVRDGEIRFKNGLDLEPILDINNGTVPPKVISFLFNGIVSMTTSFAPVFSELVISDPSIFELDNIAKQHPQESREQTFYLVTDTIQ